MLNITQFRESIVKPALSDLLLYSEDAEELLVFTCAVESLGGTYLHQINGPALGIYQMEPITYNDIWQNYIKYDNSLLSRIVTNFNTSFMPSEDRLVYDLNFATVMARIHYKRVKEEIPSFKDEDAIWDYYKSHYNSSLGKASKDEAMEKYYSFIH